jgi:hypothetical protein
MLVVFVVGIQATPLVPFGTFVQSVTVIPLTKSFDNLAQPKKARLPMEEMVGVPEKTAFTQL